MFTAVCVFLAVAAHTWMSGAGIPLWAVPAGLLPVFVSARLAAGREQSLGMILTLMGLDQTALHLLFDAAQQHAAAAAAVISSPAAIIVQLPPAPLPGMSSIPAVPTGGFQMPGMPGMPGMNGTAGLGLVGSAAQMRMTPGMLAVHVVAALVCAWWLRRGEVTVHALVGAIAAWIADRFRLPQTAGARPVLAGRPACVRAAGPTRPGVGLLRFALARRGPPLPLSV